VAEFALIDRLARHVPTSGPGVRLSLGDDAALLDPPAGQELVACTDTMNVGVHFLDDSDPRSLGHKVLAVNLSDLAAMGARPCWALLNLSLPRADEAWLDAFAQGFGDLARQFQVCLVGGDTCSGAFSLGVTLLGTVPPGQALRRDGARVGDRVFVSGTLGDAALALRKRLAGGKVDARLGEALDRPRPQVALGAGLRPLATACIDLSDGLLADLGHVVCASGVGARLSLDRLPASSALRCLPEHERRSLQLGGGEDYGLCFTAAPEREGEIQALAASLNVTVTRIGSIEAGDAIRCFLEDGSEFHPGDAGWEHFSQDAS
jgi:thiamine-monophosphate kinase